MAIFCASDLKKIQMNFRLHILNISPIISTLILGFVAITPVECAYLIQGDTTGFLKLVNSQDVSIGGTWSLTNQNRLQFNQTGQTNTFVNQLLTYNALDRTLVVGNNVPFIFFGGWGPDPLLHLPAGTQVLDLADFQMLSANISVEPLLDIKSSILLHELAEVGEPIGSAFKDAHNVGIVNQNMLLRNAGSIGQRLGAPKIDEFIPGPVFSEIKFPWQNTRVGQNGFEVFKIEGKVGNNVVPLKSEWIASGAWQSDTGSNPGTAPSSLQIDVIGYDFEAVPEPGTLLLIVAGILALGGNIRRTIGRWC